MSAPEGAEPGARRAAPGTLRLVQAFVNTFDWEARRDALSSLDGLHGWLADEHLVEPETEIGILALRQAAAVREGLRAMARANNGVPLDQEALALMDMTIQELRIAMSLTSEGSLTLVAPSPFGQAMAEILDVVRTAMDDGRWRRMKACRRDVCRWLFYDGSRNQSSHWCTMDICGNREKSKSAYHRRKDRLAGESVKAPKA
ncbi:CGNR zinc finger domain-containing protein [Nonomuraea sp. NPDC050536]|uniref:CGNR zinc finger domain-containing protein n=1 Tax=Nonomuraea sp. NPDC050536 TaxID=3364366 RepID=UPI0037CAB582